MRPSLLVAAVSFVVLAACQQSPQPPIELRLAISGMHCEDCAVALTESLRAVDGVLAAEVSLEAELARITVPAGRAEALRPQLAQSVTGLGYGAEWVDAPVPEPEAAGETSG